MTTYPTKFSQISDITKKEKKQIENSFPFIVPNSNLGNSDLCGQIVKKNDLRSTIKFCPICDRPMIIKIYILPCEHIMCFSCSQPEKGYCYICENKIESSKRLSDNTDLYECDYPDCFKFFMSADKLHIHKHSSHAIQIDNIMTNINTRPNIPMSMPFNAPSLIPGFPFANVPIPNTNININTNTNVPINPINPVNTINNANTVNSSAS